MSAIEAGPKFVVLAVPGSNCDHETKTALDLAGASASIVRLREFRERRASLKSFKGLVLPGGFGYSDAIRSGIVEANELLNYLADEVNDFVEHGGVVFGECNGFQTLVATGLLPGGRLDGNITAALTFNNTGHFECSWRTLDVEYGSRSEFLDDLPEQVSYQVAHGEGRFEASPETLLSIEKQGLVAFRYAEGENPNGSAHNIAGISSRNGRILGLMPHPTRFVRRLQHPNARRPDGIKEPHGLPLFKSIVRSAANS